MLALMLFLPSVYIPHRDALIASIRLFLAVLSQCISAHTTCHKQESSFVKAVVVGDLLLCSGSLAAIFTTLGLQMRFRLHLPIQVRCKPAEQHATPFSCSAYWAQVNFFAFQHRRLSPFCKPTIHRSVRCQATKLLS